MNGIAPAGPDFYGVGERWYPGTGFELAGAGVKDPKEQAEIAKHAPAVKPETPPVGGKTPGAYVWQDYVFAGNGAWLWQQVTPWDWGAGKTRSPQPTMASIEALKPAVPEGRQLAFQPQQDRQWWSPQGSTGRGVWGLVPQPISTKQQREQQDRQDKWQGYRQAIPGALARWVGGYWAIILAALLELVALSEKQGGKYTGALIGTFGAMVLLAISWAADKRKRKVLTP